MLLLVSLISYSCTALKHFGIKQDQISDKEVCVTADDHSLQCVDQSLPVGSQNYERKLMPGDVVTNSDDAMRSVSELIKLVSELKSCQIQN